MVTLPYSDHATRRPFGVQSRWSDHWDYRLNWRLILTLSINLAVWISVITMVARLI